MRLKRFLEKLRISKLLIVEIIVFVSLFYVYLTRDYFVVCVMGDSMKPTFHDFQFIYASKKINTIKPGQIIIFKHNDETLIKRVARTSGQFYYCDFQTPAQYYVPESNDFDIGLFEKFKIKSIEKRHLLPDEVFVLGDNFRNLYC